MTARPARALLLAALSSLAPAPAAADGLATNTVMITIFGDLGDEQEEWSQCSLLDCRPGPKKAGQWTLATILRSMVKNFGKGDKLGDTMPDAQLRVVPAFRRNGLMSAKRDQRSPFRRTVVRFRFKDVLLEAASKAADALCRDYESEEEELVKGISRAFAAAGMRPGQAITMASNMGLKLNSFIHLSISVDGAEGEPMAGYGCNWDVQPLAGTAQGMFFLPPCPGNAAAEEDAGGEGQGQTPECHCNVGYHGTIKYNHSNNRYVGDCQLVENFCRGEHEMVREDGSAARGTLDESARAKCPKGFKSTGLAKCVVSGKKGAWSPDKVCREEIPPKCVHDYNSPSARNLRASEGCEGCNIFQRAPATEGEAGPEICDCEVTCMPDTERYGGGPEGPRSCSEADPNLEQPPLCLPKRTCRKSGPVPTIAETACAAEGSKEKCLSGKENVGAGEVPCCWLGDSCAAKGSSSISWNQLPEDCALVAPEDMEICEETCVNVYKDLPNVEQKGCDDCSNAMGKDCPCEVCCRATAKALLGKDSKGAEYPPEGRKECGVVAGMVQFEEPPFCAIPCKTPDTAAGTLDISQCAPARRPDGTECFPGVADCQCVVKCPEGFMAVGGGADGDNFQCSEAGSFDGLPVCRPVCEQPGDQHGQLETGACSSCVAGAEDCDCKLTCKHRHVGGGPQGEFTCVMRPGDDERPATAVWVVKDEAERERQGDKAFQLPACLDPISISVVSATTKQPMEGVSVKVEMGGRIVAALATDGRGVARLDMVAGEEIYVIASHPGYSRIRRKFQRDVNCQDPKENCGAKLSMSEVLKFGSLNANGCYFTASDKTRQWEMRAVLEWGEVPDDLDIWARNLGCFKDVARRYGCENGNKATCLRHKFATLATEELEAQSCGSALPYTENSITELKDGKPRLTHNDLSLNQFPKWIFFDQRYSGHMHKRIEHDQAVPMKASTLKILSIAGFKPDRYCDGRPCASLDGEYLQRPGFGDTYWKGGDYFIYACQKTGEDAWVIAAAPPLDELRGHLDALRSGGDCHGLARTSPGVAILDPAKVAFPEIWEGEQHGWKPHSGAGVVRLHLPEGAKDLAWTDDHYMCLDVDEIKGKGPETVTFRNAPPGVYQIVVSVFSGKGKPDKNIKLGNPAVSLYVGTSDSALFECEIPPECKNQSKVWNVVNIEVIDGGAELDEHGKPTGESRYYMRLATTPETLEPVYELGLTTQKAHKYNATRRKRVMSSERSEYKAAKGSQYFQQWKQWDDVYLSTVCHGYCRPAAGYEQCLKPQPMPPPPEPIFF